MDTTSKTHHNRAEADAVASNSCSKWAYENRAHTSHRYSVLGSHFIAENDTEIFTAMTYYERCNSCGSEIWKVNLRVKDKFNEQPK